MQNGSRFQEVLGQFRDPNSPLGRLQALRQERLEVIHEGKAPVPLVGKTRLVVHVVGADLLAGESGEYDVGIFGRPGLVLLPQTMGGDSHDSDHFNVDGYIHTKGPHGHVQAYTQVFRQGFIEAVEADVVRTHEGIDFIGPKAIDQGLVGNLGRYLAVLQKMGVPGPYVVTLSLLETAGIRLYLERNFGHQFSETIHHPHLLLRPVQNLHPDQDLAQALRPLLDHLWQAGGARRSRSYDDNGVFRRS